MRSLVTGKNIISMYSSKLVCWLNIWPTGLDVGPIRSVPKQAIMQLQLLQLQANLLSSNSKQKQRCTKRLIRCFFFNLNTCSQTLGAVAAAGGAEFFDAVMRVGSVTSSMSQAYSSVDEESLSFSIPLHCLHSG